MYSKTNLHSGMMGRVGRQSDKVYKKEMEKYNMALAEKESSQVFSLNKMNGTQSISDFPKSEVSAFVSMVPKRVMTRMEKTRRRY